MCDFYFFFYPTATPLLPPPIGHSRPKAANEGAGGEAAIANSSAASGNSDVTVRTANNVCHHEEMPDDGDCSDTDMEIKSLDLTGKQIIYF